MKKNKITITLTKQKIKETASMVDMMISSGSLYKEHPIVELIDEIINECVKVKKNEKK